MGPWYACAGMKYEPLFCRGFTLVLHDAYKHYEFGVHTVPIGGTWTAELRSAKLTLLTQSAQKAQHGLFKE